MTGTANSAQRFDWLAGAATVLAIVACYGTLVLIGALSLMGVTLALHEGAWAGAVSVLALLAIAGVLLGYRRHRALTPLILGLAGATLILWVMFGRYDRTMETAGFTALAVAAVWDWRLKKATSQAGDETWQNPPVRSSWSSRMVPITSCHRLPSPSPTAVSRPA